jgi:hypothetical protein
MNEGHVEFPFSAKGEKYVTCVLLSSAGHWLEIPFCSCAFGCRILQSVNAD